MEGARCTCKGEGEVACVGPPLMVSHEEIQASVPNAIIMADEEPDEEGCITPSGDMVPKVLFLCGDIFYILH